jgi:hypothetical protein
MEWVKSRSGRFNKKRPRKKRFKNDVFLIVINIQINRFAQVNSQANALNIAETGDYPPVFCFKDVEIHN